jgi:hypothetical protein
VVADPLAAGLLWWMVSDHDKIPRRVLGIIEWFHRNVNHVAVVATTSHFEIDFKESSVHVYGQTGSGSKVDIKTLVLIFATAISVLALDRWISPPPAPVVIQAPVAAPTAASVGVPDPKWLDLTPRAPMLAPVTSMPLPSGTPRGPEESDDAFPLRGSRVRVVAATRTPVVTETQVPPVNTEAPPAAPPSKSSSDGPKGGDAPSAPSGDSRPPSSSPSSLPSAPPAAPSSAPPPAPPLPPGGWLAGPVKP